MSILKTRPSSFPFLYVKASFRLRECVKVLNHLLNQFLPGNTCDYQ